MQSGYLWRGSRKAVDEYFRDRGMTPLLSRIGTNGAVIANFSDSDSPLSS